jgi:hypothetical protein
MIFNAVRHGRTRRDVVALERHLNQQRDQVSTVLAIGGAPVSSARDALRLMQALRDGSRAEVSMHHIAISPSIPLGLGQVMQVVRRVLRAYQARLSPWVLWEHRRHRAREGVPETHYHLVLGHVGLDGRALDDWRSHRRLEAVARSLEWDLGELLTPCRRPEAVAAELIRMERPEVADAVREVGGVVGLPRSAMSSRGRARADRYGISLPAMKHVVRRAWEEAASREAFLSALEEHGLRTAPGTRPGVYLVQKGELVLGALDRLVGQRRGLVNGQIEGRIPFGRLEGREGLSGRNRVNRGPSSTKRASRKPIQRDSRGRMGNDPRKKEAALRPRQ